MPENLKTYRIYRANKDKKGSASAWQLSFKNQDKFNPYVCFLNVAKQLPEDDANGNAKFDWDNSITVKLGDNDIGEIISVFERRKTSVGMKGALYHQSPNGGNKIVNLEASEHGYSMSVSSQDKDKNTNRVNQTIGHGEAAFLLVLLKRYVEIIYGL